MTKDTKQNGNRERVLQMSKDGKKPKLIAKELNIATSTVYVHLHHLRKQGRL